MPKTAALQIDVPGGSYEIHVAPGAMGRLEDYLPATQEYMVVTDSNVDSLYGTCLGDVPKFVFPAGEQSKTMQTVMEIVEAMLARGLSRRAVVVALGGGVVGDMAGFAASIYMRGVPYVQVATTLLAQVDSSVGGKTGVNTRFGKNTVGSFYQPRQVIIDPETLRTLPQREIINGIGEVIKYGFIYDHAFLLSVEKQFEDLLHLDSHILVDVIKRCCAIKAAVVNEDETEQGVRKILNFGHTVGHALEAVTEYKVYTHGEAVLLGMLYETKAARALGKLDEEHYATICRVLGLVDLDWSVSHYDPEALLGHMAKDKKNRDGKVSLLLPTAPGRVEEVLLSAAAMAELWKELVQ